jgi:hypothetical protein
VLNALCTHYATPRYTSGLIRRFGTNPPICGGFFLA